ncbi:hypothetical protein BGZ83_004858 [Gryganskiella cystojenkinii]|nr:hypothetical protein BGZ83_004858 [Gryganskiella cystojenkinii]
MEDSSEFIIPHVSQDLIVIQRGLQSQLKSLEELLAQQDFFIFQQTTHQYNALVKKFLDVLQHYIDGTLKDLFQLIEDLQSLVRIYDHGLEVFMHRAGTTIRKVESCLSEVQSLVKEHEETIRDLSTTSQEITDLIKQYQTNTHNHSNVSVTARIVSISLAVTGGVVGAALAAVAAPFAAAGAVALLAGGGGGIGGAIALSDQRKSEIYAEATSKLEIVEGVSHQFKDPIHAIFKKLDRTKRFLVTLKEETEEATDTVRNSVCIRQDSYKVAQEEARKIQTICEVILQHSLAITVLQGQLQGRAQQITQF